MGAGNSVGRLVAGQLQASNRGDLGKLDYVNGHQAIVLENGTIGVAIGELILPDTYNGGQIDLKLLWSTDNNQGNVVLEVSIERMDTGTNLRTDAFGTAESQTLAVPATAGLPAKTTYNLTAGELDAVAAGDQVRVMVRRIANDADATDTCPGRVFIHGIELVDNA